MKIAPWARILYGAAGLFGIGIGISIWGKEGTVAGRLLGMSLLIGIGAACVLVALHRAPRLVLEDGGIRLGALGVVEWADIADVELRTTGGRGGEFLCLVMRDRAKYERRASLRLRFVWRQFDRREIPVAVSHLTVGAASLVALVRRRIRRDWTA